jgi:hypothetical protein
VDYYSLSTKAVRAITCKKVHCHYLFVCSFILLDIINLTNTGALSSPLIAGSSIHWSPISLLTTSLVLSRPSVSSSSSSSSHLCSPARGCNKRQYLIWSQNHNRRTNGNQILYYFIYLFPIRFAGFRFIIVREVAPPPPPDLPTTLSLIDILLFLPDWIVCVWPRRLFRRIPFAPPLLLSATSSLAGCDTGVGYADKGTLARVLPTTTEERYVKGWRSWRRVFWIYLYSYVSLKHFSEYWIWPHVQQHLSINFLTSLQKPPNFQQNPQTNYWINQPPRNISRRKWEIEGFGVGRRRRYFGRMQFLRERAVTSRSGSVLEEMASGTWSCTQ